MQSLMGEGCVEDAARKIQRVQISLSILDANQSERSSLGPGELQSTLRDVDAKDG